MIQVETYDTPYGEEVCCKKCGGDVERIDCDQCEDGYQGHDCGEDCCACLEPEDNIICDVCNGDTGWYRCLSEKCNK